MDTDCDQWAKHVLRTAKNGVYAFFERDAYELTYQRYKRRKQALEIATGERIGPFRW